MVKIIDDVSTLTTIPDKTIEKLLDKFSYCIVDAVAESIARGEEITEVDIYLGVLTIKHTSDSVKFKFTPSAKFNREIVNTIIEGENILEKVLETTLKDKITKTYKDLL